MKKGLISVILTIALLCAMLPQVALFASATTYSGTCGDGLTWTLSTNTGLLSIAGNGWMTDFNGMRPATVCPWIDYNDKITSISLPEGLTHIGMCAFFYCENLKEIRIPDSVTSIGSEAFSNCKKLEKVIFGSKLKNIDSKVFSNCSSLTEITIPNSVQRIKNHAFAGCTGLTKMTLPFVGEAATENTYLGYIFGATSVTGNRESVPKSLNTIILSDACTSIGKWAFGLCSGLTSITIGNNVKSIGNYAFQQCTGLTSITIPNSVTSIGAQAFASCTGLESLTIPESVTNIGVCAFGGCTGLESIIIPESVTSIGYNAFTICDGLTNITILNPKCSIDSDINTLGEPSTTTIYGYENSTAQTYAEKYGYKFIELSADRFSIQNNGWSFCNNAFAFSDSLKDSKNYNIPEERYESVYGKAKGQAEFQEQHWNGNCLGMVETAVLYYNRKLNSSFSTANSFYRTSYSLDEEAPDEDAPWWLDLLNFISDPLEKEDCVYAISAGRNSEETREIEAYQLYSNVISHRISCNQTWDQLLSEYFFLEKNVGDAQLATSVYKHRTEENGGNYISHMWDEFNSAYDRNEPLIIGLCFNGGGHAIVARTDKKPIKCANGWNRVYVYDPNKPYVNADIATTIKKAYKHPVFLNSSNTLVDNGDDIYIELNPEKNLWRYCTSVNANSPDQWIGCSESGEVKYRMTTNEITLKDGSKFTEKNTCPEFFCIYSPDELAPTSDYADPKLELSDWLPDSNSENIKVHAESSTNCVIYDDSGTPIAFVENGQSFPLSDKAITLTDTGTSLTNNTCSSTIYLPNEPIEISYESGTIEVLGNNNIISISASDHAQLSIDSKENQVFLEAKDTEDIHVKCANVFTRDSCSYAEASGLLEKEQSFNISFGEDDTISAVTHNGDGKIDVVYKDAESEDAEHYITLNDSDTDPCTGALGHSYTYKVTSTPTTSKTGALTGTCSRCSATTTVTLPKLNTTDYTYSVTTAATCTATGTGCYTWKTTIYGSFYFDVTIEKNSHTYKAAVTTPTCTAQGYTMHTCSTCGDCYKDTYTAALGHSWNGGAVTTQPTETSKGVKTFTCTRCGETKTEAIPASGKTDTDCGGNKNTCPSAQFTDVAGYGNWSHNGIDFCINRELFGGMSATRFEPDTAMNRAMLVTVLWRYEGSPKGYSNSFSDIKSGEWYTDAVSWASSNGIVNGVGGGKFNPEGIVTREQLATILYRYSEWKGFDVSGRADFSSFPDAGKVGSWAKAAMQWAVAENLIGGSNEGGKTYILPSNGATRAQVATILMRFIQNIAEEKPYDPKGHTYEYICGKRSWSEAQAIAKEKGGYLVHFDDMDEFNYVTRQLNRKGYRDIRFLIGGKRAEGSQDYYWVDTDDKPFGEKLNSPKAWCSPLWYSGEPTFEWQGVEECYLQLAFMTDVSQWVLNDIDDNQGYPKDPKCHGFIIEFE